MLEIRPNCECCDKDLLPNSSEAMICSYECTFCRSCVNDILKNVCPNCGGGFTTRPIRPKTERRRGLSRTLQPGSKNRTHTKYTLAELKAFAEQVRCVLPEER